jgi:putative modified peptide
MATHSPELLDKLLDKLSGDDTFRENFLSDPAHALSNIGIRLEAGQIPHVRSLPAKSTIAASRAAIKGKLDNALGAFPFFLSGR